MPRVLNQLGKLNPSHPHFAYVAHAGQGIRGPLIFLGLNLRDYGTSTDPMGIDVVLNNAYLVLSYKNCEAV